LLIIETIPHDCAIRKDLLMEPLKATVGYLAVPDRPGGESN
jgi:hypothetical protein